MRLLRAHDRPEGWLAAAREQLRRRHWCLLSQEHAQHCLAALGGDQAVVATLEGAADRAAHRLQQHRRHVRKARWCHLHAPLRVAVGGVESSRDYEEIGAESAQNRQHDERERGEVVGVMHPILGPRDVDVAPDARARAHLVELPGLRIPPVSKAVERDVEDSCLLVEEVLRAVAVVDVPIKDGYLAHALRERAARGHRYRVVEAEALSAVARRVIRARVVSWWPHERKGDWAIASGRFGRRSRCLTYHVERSINHAAAREPRCCVSMR